jgi:MFS-type transporter involved in bile tolerance (Atg22 family)
MRSYARGYSRWLLSLTTRKGKKMKSAITFSLVGVAFLILFLPYILWAKTESRLKRSRMTDSAIIARLGRMAALETIDGAQ